MLLRPMGETAAALDAVTRLQQRWGVVAIRRGATVGEAALALSRPLSQTGFAALDTLLAPRGLPHGLILLRGSFGSGRTTLALRALATIQAAGGAAAWIDGSRTFDPLEAATRGVTLASLPIIVPLHTAEALEMAGAVLAADAADALVLDLSGVREHHLTDATLERLAARARRTGASLLLLTDQATGVHADLSLLCATTRLLRTGSDIVGRALEVTITSGPRMGSSVNLKIFEGRGAREDLRIGRIEIKEVLCARFISAGQH